MDARALQTILKDGDFTLSELGDDTSVLTSLTNSQIISLNKLGTNIVSTLLRSDEKCLPSVILNIVDDLTKEYKLSRETAESDVTSFINELWKSIDIKK